MVFCQSMLCVLLVCCGVGLTIESQSPAPERLVISATCPSSELGRVVVSLPDAIALGGFAIQRRDDGERVRIWCDCEYSDDLEKDVLDSIVRLQQERSASLVAYQVVNHGSVVERPVWAGGQGSESNSD